MALLKRVWPFLLLIILSLFAILPLFHPGFFPIHDDEQIARLQQLTLVINNFQIPPRWVPDLGFGFGFPLYNFYPPLFYYLGYLVHLFGVSFITSTKIVIGLGFILSSFFMFIWAKKHFGMVAGIFSAFLYTYVPYHAVDVYVRGALSEFFSFVFIPGVFWSFDRVAEKKDLKNSLLAGFFLGLVILTHNLVFIQFIPFLLVYLIYLLYKERKYVKRILLLFTASITSSIGLTLYFTLPALLEKQYTLVDKILTGELANYKLYFVCPTQFINSPWGYGGSVPGCLDGMSLQIGKVPLFISLLAFYLLIFFIPFKKIFKVKNILLPSVIFILFVFSLFMQISYSGFIWNAFKPLSYIQFPWRFLLFTAVFSSFLGGFAVSFLQKYVNKYILYIFLLILVIVNLYTVRNYFKPQSYLKVSDSFYTSKQDIQWRVSNLSYEYVPKEVATKLSSKETTILDISKEDLPDKPFQVLSGEIEVNRAIDKPQYKKFEVLVSVTGQFRVNTFSFPGWKVLVDSKKVEYNDNNKLKLIQVGLFRGNHVVEVVFSDTLPRTIGNIVSGLTILFLFVFLMKLIVKKKKI